MSAMVGLRFDLRVAPFADTTHAAQYAACLDMCEWADATGFDVVAISEHHGVEDGYMSSPVTLAAAIAARTKRISINIAAILVPLHDPIRLAERRLSRRRTGGVRRDRGRARPRAAPSADGRARSRARLGESPAVRDGGPAAYPLSYAGGTTGFPAAFHPFSPSTITLTSV